MSNRNQTYTIRPLEESDKETLLQFLYTRYPKLNDNKDISTRYYEWKYFDKKRPHSGFPSALLLTTHSDEIVGMIGTLPFTLKNKEDLTTSAWICDWRIDESVKGHGFGQQLLNHALNHYKTVACIDGSEDAQRVYKNLEFKKYNAGVQWTKVLRPMSLAIKKQSGILGKTKGIVKSFHFYPVTVNKAVSKIALKPVDNLSDIAFANYNTKNSGMERSESYFQWIKNAPVNTLHFFHIMFNGNVSGYVVCLSDTDYYGAKRIRIIDWGHNDALNMTILHLIAICRNQFKNLNPHYIEGIESRESLPLLKQINCSIKEKTLWLKSSISDVSNLSNIKISLLDKDNAFRHNQYIP